LFKNKSTRTNSEGW